MDLDYAGYKGTRKSTKGNIFIVVGGSVSWESKCQEIVVLSTVESKYMAFTHATAQALLVLKFFTEVGLPQHTPIIVHADNNGSIINSTTDKHHCQTKHINVKYHFVKEHTKKGEILFSYIPSSNNLADLFTKPLPCNTIWCLTSMLGLIPKVDNMSVQGEY